MNYRIGYDAGTIKDASVLVLVSLGKDGTATIIDAVSGEMADYIQALEISKQALLAHAHILKAEIDALEADNARLLKALENLVAADNCNYQRDTMRYTGLFDAARAAIYTEAAARKCASFLKFQGATAVRVHQEK
ncbi:MAG: hypothetical protein WAP47_08645 [Candidatus Rokuibacteriota bacterium]